MLIDSHCHLDAGEFDTDRDAVLRRARAANVGAQVVPATHAAGWPNLRTVCASSPGLHAAYGLHPMFLDRHAPGDLDDLRAWLAREQPVAVGECGLDYFVEGLDPALQQDFFDAQLALARESGLPVIVHARRAVDRVIASVRAAGPLRGVVHSFSGSEQQARQLWDLGFLVGIGGPVTYGRAVRLRRLVATMPLDFLLLETDAPDQPDSAIRGERNEPARLAVVCAAVAELRGEDPAEVAAATATNARDLFGLDDER